MYDYILITLLYSGVMNRKVCVAKVVESITEKIEECDRKEFIKNGYVDVSIGTIVS